MASKEEYDQYAAELNRRFDELTGWAIAHWPKKDFPLLASDFDRSRREIAGIIGPKLGDVDTGPPASGNGKDAAPFVDMNPMPWP